jgi:Glyoxalase-like domain
MQRPVETINGSATAVFTVARVEPGEMAEGRLQMLTHHTEDTVWQPRWLVHPNGALGLASLAIAVTDVEETAKRLTRFTGRPAVKTRAVQAIRLDRGRIELVTGDALTEALPEIAIPSLPFMVAYGVTVKSLDTVASVLREGKLTSRRSGDCLIARFPDALGYGAWLFAERNDFSLFA